MLTLPAFVVSCERTDVREYEAPKETFPQKAAVREQIEQAQNSAQTSAISLKAPPGWQRPASGADAESQLCRRGSRRGEGGYFCDELSG